MRLSILIKDMELKCGVGALLYTPALNSELADMIINGDFGCKYSIALCLEDSISDNVVEKAELQVTDTLQRIFNASLNKKVFIPKIFVRVRNPKQVHSIYDAIKSYESIFNGFIFPKYTIRNALEYNTEIENINKISGKKIYMMPILESSDIAEPLHRIETLVKIKKYIDSMYDYILNIRVGGNDFSNRFAVRRNYDETIYDILPVSQILSDILTVFSREYIISGPVWEFFSSNSDVWKKGMQRELKLDKLNGFTGKTVIHPNQIQVVNEMLKVTKKDYEDAKTILNWTDSSLQVGKSYGGDRMNEVKTNYSWAEKIMIMAKIYGII